MAFKRRSGLLVVILAPMASQSVRSTRHSTDTAQKALATPTHLQSSNRSLGKRAITDITCGGYATAGEFFLDCDSNKTSTNNIRLMQTDMTPGPTVRRPPRRKVQLSVTCAYIFATLISAKSWQQGKRCYSCCRRVLPSRMLRHQVQSL
jgi:hypothetical protein